MTVESMGPVPSGIARWWWNGVQLRLWTPKGRMGPWPNSSHSLQPSLVKFPCAFCTRQGLISALCIRVVYGAQCVHFSPVSCIFSTCFILSLVIIECQPSPFSRLDPAQGGWHCSEQARVLGFPLTGVFSPQGSGRIYEHSSELFQDLLHRLWWCLVDLDPHEQVGKALLYDS